MFRMQPAHTTKRHTGEEHLRVNRVQRKETLRDRASDHGSYTNPGLSPRAPLSQPNSSRNSCTLSVQTK